MPQKQMLGKKKGKTFPLGNALPTLHSRYRTDSIWNFCFDRRMTAPPQIRTCWVYQRVTGGLQVCKTRIQKKMPGSLF